MLEVIESKLNWKNTEVENGCKGENFPLKRNGFKVEIEDKYNHDVNQNF